MVKGAAFEKKKLIPKEPMFAPHPPVLGNLQGLWSALLKSFEIRKSQIPKVKKTQEDE